DEAAGRDGHNTTFHLVGPPGAGRRALAESVCRQLGIPLLVADLERLIAGPVSAAEAFRLIARETLLLPAALCLEHLAAVTSDPRRSAQYLRPLLAACRSCSRLTFLIGTRSWLPPDLSPDEPFFPVPVDLPELGASRGVWQSSAAAFPLGADI